MGDALIAAGVINGGLIGMVLLYRGVAGRNSSALMVGALVLIGALAVILIQTSSVVPARAIEVLLVLLSGALLVLLTGRMVGRPIPSWLLGLAVLAACWVVGMVDRFLGGDPVRPAVLLQMGFTAWAWVLFLRPPTLAHLDRRRRAHRQSRVALVLLVSFSVLHVAQLLRLMMPDNDLLRSLVPLTLGLVFTTVSVLVAMRLISSQLLAPLDTAPSEAAATPTVLASLRAYLDHDKRYADPSLRLAEAPVLQSIKPSVLAQALHAEGHAGLAGYLQWVRLEHARAQLVDPAEARTSIEAIGLGCGFRSRSTLYDAFERETGLTPGAYRTRAFAENVSE